MCKIEDNITGYRDYLESQFKAEVMYHIQVESYEPDQPDFEEEYFDEGYSDNNF